MLAQNTDNSGPWSQASAFLLLDQFQGQELIVAVF